MLSLFESAFVISTLNNSGLVRIVLELMVNFIEDGTKEQ